MSVRFWTIEKDKGRAMLSWLFVGALFVFGGVLGVLQYRWIGEVSVAERERLQASLQVSLNRLSRDFNTEILTACRALLPANSPPGVLESEAELTARYQQWKNSNRHRPIFSRIAIALPQNQTVLLRNMDLETGVLRTGEWPAAWTSMKERLESRLSGEPWMLRRRPGPFGGGEGLTFEIPFSRMSPADGPPGRFGRRESEWLIIDLNPQYVREVLLPELLQRHLGAGGPLDYKVEVLTKANPPLVIYQTDLDRDKEIAARADASVSLFDPPLEQMFRRGGPPGGPDPPPRRGPGPDMGRWQMFVRHRAGSLEALVSQARRRNLAVTAGILLLMAASAAALMRYTRRAQMLAGLQMDFVAGVSHELRTPLTVIHTAAYNLRGNLRHNPVQVERYGALIQRESGRLKDLVEQVLQFAGAKAGRVIQAPEPLSVEEVIEETMESSKAVIEASHCVVEKTIDPGLPLVLGDPMALKRALQNLLSNAAKYGAEGSNWIGVSASKVDEGEQAVVEIRVSDRGPGIPEDEQERIFDPFFRGRRAVQDQVHGTGLGLSLVKRIVEAHGGSIRVRSVPMKGTEFIVRIPAAPPQHQDEFADSLSRG